MMKPKKNNMIIIKWILISLSNRIVIDLRLYSRALDIIKTIIFIALLKDPEKTTKN